MEASITQKFTSFFHYSKIQKNRKEILSLAEVLKKSESQKIEIPDYTTNNNNSRRSVQSGG